MDHTIAYYHGCYANYFDLETGRAVVEVFEKNNFAVEVPELICCGFPLFYSGNIDAARKRADTVVESLVDYVRKDCEIVYSCPTCGYALKEVYPYLLATEEARLVAEKTSLASAHLLNLHKTDRLNANFKELPLTVAYHTPCHLRSQDLATASAELLALIPGVKMHYLDRGCCGMGGTWALRSKRHSDVSAEIGAMLFEEIKKVNPKLIATDCAGCKIQMARYTGRAGDRVVHPMQLLAEAYS